MALPLQSCNSHLLYHTPSNEVSGVCVAEWRSRATDVQSCSRKLRTTKNLYLKQDQGMLCCFVIKKESTG